jgi:hypothetical protein
MRERFTCRLRRGRGLLVTLRGGRVLARERLRKYRRL